MRRLFFVAVFAALGLLTATPSFAEEVSVSKTVSVNVGMLGQSLIGTAVGTYTIDRDRAQAATASSPVALHVNWTCQCSVNGVAAALTGTWDGTWDGKDYRGTITSVNNWPAVPIRTFTLNARAAPSINIPSPSGHVFDVLNGSVFVSTQTGTFGRTSLQLNVQSGGFDSSRDLLPGPLSPLNNFQATNRTGVQEIIGLPRTGEQPAIYNILALAGLVLGAGVLGVSRRIARKAN